MEKLKDEIEKILIDCDRIDFPGGKQFYRKEAVKRIMEKVDKHRPKLRPALAWFVELMEKDLKKNDFKGGWTDGRLDYYWGKAIDHLSSLRPVDSIKFFNPKIALGHCYKAANYAMMLAHNIFNKRRL